jgi:hypothetical protein
MRASPHRTPSIDKLKAAQWRSRSDPGPQVAGNPGIISPLAGIDQSLEPLLRKSNKAG